jgi:hypothetical protein
VALTLVLLSARPARAGDSYFVVVFGSQRTPNNPNCSHSWATFVRVSGARPCPQAEAHTISWLPETMTVRTWALLAECGRNFDLHTTLRYVLANDERVSMWGPYQIDADLYGRALKQIALLESGEVKYKAIDTGRHSDRVSNCIHAISSIVEGYRLCVASPWWGEPASYTITRKLMPWVVDPDQRKFQWVGTWLGLDGYPIIHRDCEDPRSGPIRSAVQRALGIENTPEPTYGPPR